MPDPYTRDELDTLSDVVSWTGIEDRTGIPSGTLRQWYRRPTRKLGGTGMSMRDLVGNARHTPPLFLWRHLKEPLRLEKRSQPGMWSDGTDPDFKKGAT